MLTSVELFGGVGGLALGATNAGFRHLAVVERDRDACNTIRVNQNLRLAPVLDWPLHEADVTRFDFGTLPSDIDLLAAGVPCQPWSLGGKHQGYQDERNMFPEMVRAILRLTPKCILIENVKGLLRDSFARYFEYITLMLARPEVSRKPGEDWLSHLGRLERRQTSGSQDGLQYNIVFRLLNAADYGVPQRRERVFIVGFRSDLGLDWSFPAPTHTQERLLESQWITGEYWDRHGVSERNRPPRPAKQAPQSGLLPLTEPWRTVRDAISDLPEPGLGSGVLNHTLNPGARSYPGHTGSPLDEPAKTLKAGDHGVPGGENMLRLPSGEVRYFTVRESARLQTFPDEFAFDGSWSENMRQLGNAVPVRLSEAAASGIARRLQTCGSNNPTTRWTKETSESALPMRF